MRRHAGICIIVSCYLIFSSGLLIAGAQSESAGSATRGKYLAGKGIIIPPEEVYVDAYIAQIDYDYPEPEGDVGVFLYSGYRQLSSKGQEEVFHIGIQARERRFEDLPPMNLAFVIDKSGSMSSADKMEWVKESFDIFIERVRDIDYVSLITFDNEAAVLFPATRMNDKNKRLQFKQKVHAIEPGGGTNLVAGLKLGYKEAMTYFREIYANRVLFLTDGRGDSEGILDMAARYKEIGVNCSTIGLGTDFDLKLMQDLAKKGGGSSRFISDRDEMEETFGSELDRMVVPAALDLSMECEVLIDAEIEGTWGYDYVIKGNRIGYSLPTLHHRDYETMLVHVNIPPNNYKGKKDVLRFTLSYTDLGGKRKKIGPYTLASKFVTDPSPVTGFSDAMVLRSGTMMQFALELKTIGGIYYNARKEIDELNNLKNRLWSDDMTEDQYETLTSPDIEALETKITAVMKSIFDRCLDIRKVLENVRLRLDNEGFEDEIKIMDNYISIIGKELAYDEKQVAEIRENAEIEVPVKDRSIEAHLSHLFDEMILGFPSGGEGVIAVSGFTSKPERPMRLLDLLNEMAIAKFSGLDTMTMVERDKLDIILEEQELAVSDLMDTTTAIRIGNFLAADFIVTGTVIEMGSSLAVFGRVINVETAEVESVAQVIVQKNSEVKKLLGN
ncbi:MAG: VWA domain-containing protein [Spirochaetales bacterium]|nr:VWA domain-containing protein [Spirochaetales bacterium]